MLKVVDSLKKALQIMADEYNAKVFEVDGTIFTADQVLSRYEKSCKGSMEVSESGIYDENHLEIEPLTGEVDPRLMDVINFRIMDDEKHEMIVRPLRELAAILAVEADYNALGNEWVQKWLPEFQDYTNCDTDDAEAHATMEMQESLWNERSTCIDDNTHQVVAAEYGAYYPDGEGVNRKVLIRCCYGEWFGTVEGTAYLPITVDCLKNLLDSYAEFVVDSRAVEY